jgi:restriction system protein
MKSKSTWMVRAEVGGKYFEDFKSKSIVAIGWLELGDMSPLKNREAFSQAVAKAYPEMKKMQVAVSAGQTYRFVREIKVGDRVLTYDPSGRVYLVGTINSDYFYEPSLIEGDPNCRRVTWEGEVSRDMLSVSTKNSLGAISTLFLLPDEAASEIEGLLSGKKPVPTLMEPEEEETAVGSILKDIQGKASSSLKTRWLSWTGRRCNTVLLVCSGLWDIKRAFPQADQTREKILWPHPMALGLKAHALSWK